MQNLIASARSFFARVDREDRGATMVEYGIMVALIAVIAIAAVTFLGRETCTTFNETGQKLDAATTTGTTGTAATC